MVRYIVKRLLLMVPTLVAISIVSFTIINLPPGDFVDRIVAQRLTAGEAVTAQEAADLRAFYGLDRSVGEQYVVWVSNIFVRGDFGRSFRWDLPVRDLVWERMALTLLLSVSSLLFIWVVAIPIGIFSAVRRYSLGDYIATFLGFVGVSIPNFLLALVLMFISFRYFGQSVGGLFSPQYINAPWSLAKILDLLGHLWIPMIVLGTAGTASLVRTLRANLLDELSRPYVTTARTKGLPESWLIVKYPLRHALNPFVSDLNGIFVDLVSGSTIVAVVLSLQTTGPLLLDALRSEDMFLAGSFIMLMSMLAVVGTLFSDILLAWLDPRIRYR
ncbi:MAG: ABC transporter permease [Chloroflexi bacterium]|jgi:peptide/nickel transport system permease protein|nr:ABC transporter permease [Chloroflexota bacterium]